MKIETFWNKAFLAALTRLPAGEAKQEADRAMEMCLQHWQSSRFRMAKTIPWKDQKIANTPRSDA